MVTVYPSSLFGTLFLPPSKSVVARYMLCSAHPTHPTEIKGDFSCKDLRVLLQALSDLNANVETTADGVKIARGKPVSSATVYCGESGTCLRFLIPYCACFGIQTQFIVSESLLKRPVEDLQTVLSFHGCTLEKNPSGYLLKGKCTAGDFYFDSFISSQPISGFLMSLPLLEQKSTLHYTRLPSKSYIDTTIDTMKKFGVRIEEEKNGYVIFPQTFQGGRIFTVEGDWSQAVFWAVGATLTGKITLCGLNFSSTQGDKIFLEYFRKIGIRYIVSGDTLTVYSSEIQPFCVDVEDCIDLFPALCVLACFAKGKSTLQHIERLQYKESDRVEEMYRLLSAFSVRAFQEENNFIIEGGMPKGCTYTFPNDHRIAMAGGILAVTCKEESHFFNENSVEKSYPNFWTDLQKVGGKVKWN